MQGLGLAQALSFLLAGRRRGKGRCLAPERELRTYAGWTS